MSKNNNKSSINRSNGPRRKQRPPRRRNRGLNPNSDLSVPPMRNLVYGPTNPGRVMIRGVFEVLSVGGSASFSYTSFATWSSSARALLTPFMYFRVNQVKVRARIAGGTSSTHSILFNISNVAYVDTSAVAILNDDYSAVATAAVQPILSPPTSYWKQGARTWYNSVDEVDDVPSAIDRIAGTISYEGTGGALPGTVVGWMIVDMELQFHTLI